MGIFGSTPEEKDRRERERAAKLEQDELAKRADEKKRKEAAFRASPIGQARASKEAGNTIFQIDLALSETKGFTIGKLGTLGYSTGMGSSAGVIQGIEAEGWRLDNVGYVFRITGSISKDSSLTHGRETSTTGEIVGIYLFRSVDDGTSVKDTDTPRVDA